MRRTVRRIESPEMQAAKDFGSKLYKAVFTDEVQSALRSSLDQARAQGSGLRIRLRLNDAPELVDIPWEYLYNPSLNRFLALSVNTPVVRASTILFPNMEAYQAAGGRNGHIQLRRPRESECAGRLDALQHGRRVVGYHRS